MAPDDVLEDVAEILGLVERRQHCVNRARSDLVSAFDEPGQLVDHRSRLGDLGIGPLDREAVAPQEDRAAEALPKRAENAVVESRQLGGDVVGYRQNLLHGASV